MTDEAIQTDGLIRFAAMITRARANALPKIPRFTLSDKCMGHVVDDANAGVSGAASVLESCPNAALRDRAAHTLIEIAAAYKSASAGNVTASGGMRGAAPAPVIASKQVSREIGTQLPQGIGNRGDSPSIAASTIGKQVSPSIPDTADPKVSSASRMKALNAVRGLPGYELPKPVEPIKGGLF